MTDLERYGRHVGESRKVDERRRYRTIEDLAAFIAAWQEFAWMEAGTRYVRQAKRDQWTH